MILPPSISADTWLPHPIPPKINLPNGPLRKFLHFSDPPTNGNTFSPSFQRPFSSLRSVRRTTVPTCRPPPLRPSSPSPRHISGPFPRREKSSNTISPFQFDWPPASDSLLLPRLIKKVTPSVALRLIKAAHLFAETRPARAMPSVDNTSPFFFTQAGYPFIFQPLSPFFYVPFPLCILCHPSPLLGRLSDPLYNNDSTPGDSTTLTTSRPHPLKLPSGI